MDDVVDKAATEAPADIFGDRIYGDGLRWEPMNWSLTATQKPNKTIKKSDFSIAPIFNWILNLKSTTGSI